MRRRGACPECSRRVVAARIARLRLLLYRRLARHTLLPNPHQGSHLPYGAGNGTRTRDPELGRLALYQLSYSRPAFPHLQSFSVLGGEGRIRTSEGVRRQIYSLLPLAAREPLPKHSLFLRAHLSRWRESNSQPTDYKSVALPLSYIGPEQRTFCLIAVIMGSQAGCSLNNGRFWPCASSRPSKYYSHHEPRADGPFRTTQSPPPPTH
jgi:hypothetical protein